MSKEAIIVHLDLLRRWKRVSIPFVARGYCIGNVLKWAETLGRAVSPIIDNASFSLDSQSNHKLRGIFYQGRRYKLRPQAAASVPHFAFISPIGLKCPT